MTMPLVDLATRGFIVFAVIMREKIEVFEDVRESPSRMLLTGNFRAWKSRKLRLLTGEHISRISLVHKYFMM